MARLPWVRRKMMDSRDGRLAWVLESRGLYHETLRLPTVRAALAARRAIRGADEIAVH